MENQKLDPERQQSAKKYARIRRRFMLVELLLVFLYLLIWLILGWSNQLRDWIFSFTESPWLVVIVFGMIFGGIYTLISLPLSFYTGFSLPHRFGQSTQERKGWWFDFLKSLLISGLIGGILLEIIYLILRISPNLWWLWTGGFLLLFNVLLANLAPVLLFPLFNKFTPLEDGYQDLQKRLLNLADRAGIKVMGVYTFDMSRRTKSANAGLTGLGNTRRIILGDTLLEEFPEDEIETVLAHEMGHHNNKDIPLGMIVQTIITLGGLYLASLGLSWGTAFFGFESTSDIAALPLLALSLGAYGMLTMPLSNGFSRWRENLSDDFALRLTGNGQAYANALIRLSNQNLAEVDPEPWVEFLLYSHPSLSKRIQKARGYTSNFQANTSAQEGSLDNPSS
jgi:STE24 endopeptidase